MKPAIFIARRCARFSKLMDCHLETKDLWEIKPPDYNEILIKAGFNVVKDAEYRFQISRKLTKEWREIRAFRDQLRSSKMPQELSEEIRKEYEKSQDGTSQDVRMSSWKIVIAENA